jgi:shikimate kinase
MTAGRVFPGVALVGFMGSGKSAVGRELARRLRADFVDTDERIERAAGKSIPEIFSGEGEPAFREREKTALREALSVPGRVVATGGGAFLSGENRAMLAAYGPVVYLEARAETLLARLGEDTGRPLLQGDDPGAILRDLLAQRTPVYRVADHTVVTDGLTVEEVADRVERLLAETEAP